METTECSHCEKLVEPHPFDGTDSMFDWQCPNCGQKVLLDGNAKEQQRQRQARREITERIQNLATEIDSPGYAPPPYSVEELKQELESILDDVNEELKRRQSN
jgi:DNA-directed RNA polymerase subunit RPC12/RpoP